MKPVRAFEKTHPMNKTLAMLVMFGTSCVMAFGQGAISFRNVGSGAVAQPLMPDSSTSVGSRCRAAVSASNCGTDRQALPRDH